MKDGELEALYRDCIYLALDDKTMEELSEWECRAVFFPALDEMKNKKFRKADLARFARACYLDYLVSEEAYERILEKYGLQREVRFEAGYKRFGEYSPLWEYYNGVREKKKKQDVCIPKTGQIWNRKESRKLVVVREADRHSVRYFFTPECVAAECSLYMFMERFEDTGIASPTLALILEEMKKQEENMSLQEQG